MSAKDEVSNTQTDKVVKMLSEYEGINTIQIAKLKQEIQSAQSKVGHLDLTIMQKDQQVKTFQDKIDQLDEQLKRMQAMHDPKNREDQLQLKEEIRNLKNKKEDVLQEVMRFTNEKTAEVEKIEQMKSKQAHVAVFDPSCRTTTRSWGTWPSCTGIFRNCSTKPRASTT